VAAALLAADDPEDGADAARLRVPEQPLRAAVRTEIQHGPAVQGARQQGRRRDRDPSGDAVLGGDGGVGIALVRVRIGIGVGVTGAARVGPLDHFAGAAGREGQRLGARGVGPEGERVGHRQLGVQLGCGRQGQRARRDLIRGRRWAAGGERELAAAGHGDG